MNLRTEMNIRFLCNILNLKNCPMKKFHKDLFFSVLVIVFFFLSSNAYAQESGIPLESGYESAIGVSNLGQGATEEDEYSAPRSNAVTTTAAVNNALLFIDPSISSNYDKILESQNISPDMKRGIFGLTQDGVRALYDAQPMVNVYAHLADEWLPGYQTGNVIYAASDSGYDSLVNTGISVLWAEARNITYVFFIIIMLVVGFMIMFRSKLGGQTLVTLGNTLPNIILALIGVTFSFAIAGLIIDLGGVIMQILDDIFLNVSGYSETVKLGSIGDLFRAFIPEGLRELNPLNNSGPSGKGLLGVFGVGGGIAAALGLIISSTSALSIGLPFLLLALAVLGVATVGVFKVFLTLIKAYLGILINVITAPFQIAISAMPGKGVSFVNWMKKILRNVLVYPITFAILNLPGVLYAISGGELTLPGPGKLTLSENMTTIGENRDIFSGGNLWDALLILILQIFVLFVASKADKYAQAIIPPTTSREAGAAAEEAKKSLSGIPLVGSLLGK